MSDPATTKSKASDPVTANPMNRGGWGAMGRPVEKAKDFSGTLKRLLLYFKPEKVRLSIVVASAILGTIFNIVGPKILGLATTKLFDDLIASFIVQVKNNLIQKQLLQNPALSIHSAPVPGIEFGYIGTVLLILLGLYVISSIFIFIQQFLTKIKKILCFLELKLNRSKG